MRKTTENKQTNSTKNSKTETKTVKNCGGKGCGKNTKNCK